MVCFLFLFLLSCNLLSKSQIGIIWVLEEITFIRWYSFPIHFTSLESNSEGRSYAGRTVPFWRCTHWDGWLFGSRGWGWFWNEMAQRESEGDKSSDSVQPPSRWFNARPKQVRLQKDTIDLGDARWAGCPAGSNVCLQALNRMLFESVFGVEQRYLFARFMQHARLGNVGNGTAGTEFVH